MSQVEPRSSTIRDPGRVREAPPGFRAGERVVLFDGVCKLCSRWVQFLIKRDPEIRLKLCSLQSPRGQAILEHLGLRLDDFDTMIFLQHGRAFHRSRAFLEVLRHLPFPWPLLRAGVIVPGFLRDLLYNLIARNRYRLFGKNETCPVPTDEIRAHFLEEES